MTSRKLIICLLASMVMRSPLLLKMRHISFLMFSVSPGEALVMASPSSRYSPTFMSRCWSCERRKLPTSSHVSAPSKLPIVTSNAVFPFFCQGCCLWMWLCLQPCVIYQAAVTRKDNNKKDTYIGLTENTFKTRYRNHTASFRHAKLRNSTELSKHIWTLKDNCIDHFISWRILSSHSPYSSASKRCNLCLKEKFLIICQPDLSTLNKRNELVSSCRHRNKALLRNS